MLAHTKTHHTNIPDRDKTDMIYFSYQNTSYAIPKRVAEKYRISPALVPHISEIENKFTKAGVLLKGLRIREGLTQIQFAQKIHITQANLSNMENGRRLIGKQIAKRIEKIFKVNYRYFLT